MKTSTTPLAPARPPTTPTTTSPSHSATPATRHYAGNGDKPIGTIVVKSPVVLTWTAAKPKMQIFTSKGFVLVNSTASSGSVHLSKGTYRGVRVASGGTWAIVLRPKRP